MLSLSRRASVLLLIVLLSLAACNPATPAAPTATTAPPTATTAAATATSPPTATTAAATATTAPPTETSVPPTNTSVPPTATTAATAASEGETVTLELVEPLSTIEELEDISQLLHDIPGILDVTGNENQVNIMFDPSVTDINGVIAAMALIGFPVKPPG
jgi:hypothetical protein